MPANSNKPDAEQPGEGRISNALARAEAAVASLAQDYATWALADVAKARTALAAAIDDPAGHAPHVEALFRVGHDLKGQGTSFGFPLVTKIGHSLCALTRDRARQYRAGTSTSPNRTSTPSTSSSPRASRAKAARSARSWSPGWSNGSASCSARAPAKVVERHRQQQHHAARRVLVEGRHVHQAHAVVEAAHQQGADQRAQHAPAPA